MARWSDDNWVVRHPDENKIKCKDCVFRANDRMYNGKVVYAGACLGVCEVYSKGDKPNDILFDGAECEYYISEDEDEEE